MDVVWHSNKQKYQPTNIQTNEQTEVLKLGLLCKRITITVFGLSEENIVLKRQDRYMHNSKGQIPETHAGTQT